MWVVRVNLLSYAFNFRKHQKQRPVSAGVKKSRDRGHGNKDKNDEKMYNLVEHRLPRKGIQEMLQGNFTNITSQNYWNVV